TNFVAGSIVIDPTSAGNPGLPPILVSPLTITANSLATITYQVTITDPVPAGVETITNTVFLTSTSGVTGTDTVTDSVASAVPALTITKTLTVSSPVTIGAPVQFEIVVENTGDTELTSVPLTDTYDTTYLSYVGASPGSDDNFDDGAINWTNVGPIAVGDSITVTVNFTAITSTAPLSTVNTASASATDQNGVDVPEENDDAEVQIVSPAIQITKGPDNQTVVSGDTVTFTITVTNTGDVTLSPVAITDAWASDCDRTIPSLAHSNSTSYTCSVTNVLTDFTNTAIVNGTPPTGEVVTDTDVAEVDVLPTITVAKTASPTSVAEPGDVVTFTVRVKNTSAETLTLTSLVDDIHGDLDGQGTCSVTQTIAVGGFDQCQFSATVSGSAGDSETDTVTAEVEDDEGNTASNDDDATVNITDVLPTITVVKTASLNSVSESGGVVTFTVRVNNTSAETLTLTSLVDDIHCDLNGQGTCSVTQTISVGDYYQCQFSAMVSGNADDSETDVVTAEAEDDEGNTASGDDDATVTVSDVLPTITVAKTASPTSVAEPGGVVTFTVRVNNTSAETLTLASLVDDIRGDLNGQGTCSVTQTIAVGDYYQCQFTATVSGNAGDSETDTVTAEAEDDDGNTASGDDEATVSITDVLPTITVAKTASPTSVSEPGAVVTFTVRV
ncbi:MAG: hypothetical protein JSW51_05050, partial [Gemmatimonadota bacterium]